MGQQGKPQAIWYKTEVIIANHLLSAVNSARINRKTRIDVNLSLNAELDPVLQVSYRF